jgi:integral membrane sensor domain MASE1
MRASSRRIARPSAREAVRSPPKEAATSADSPSTTLHTGRGNPISASSARYAAVVVVIAAASFALAQGGKALLLTGPAGAFWPAGGLGIAVLYLGGLRWWPGVLLGDLGSLLWDVLSTDLAVPVGSALAEAAGDMARTLLAVFILHWLAGPRAAMDRLRDVGAVLVGVASGAAISATVAMLALRAGNVIADTHLTEFWRSWWLGDVAGGLVVIPLALAWTCRPTPAWRGRGWEGALMMAAVVALSAIAMSADQPLTYIVFPAFIWAALRFGPRGATLAVAVAVVIAVWATSNHLGPFVEHLPTDSALNLQLYITFAALTTLCLAAIVSERRRVALELAESRSRVAAAGAEERHRLERELHDSAQNRLIALQMRLVLARERRSWRPLSSRQPSIGCWTTRWPSATSCVATSPAGSASKSPAHSRAVLAPSACSGAPLKRTAVTRGMHGRDRRDVRGVSTKARREHVGRPAPRRRRPSEQRKKCQGRGHQGPAEGGARPRLSHALPEPPVQQAECRAVAPAQQQSEVVIAAVGDVWQMHDRRDDPAGDEGVVVVERLRRAASQPALACVGERHRRRSGGAG